MAQGFNLDGYENGLTARKIAEILFSLFPGTCIASVGSHMAATIRDNNTVRFADGTAFREGRAAIIDPSDYDDFPIPNGTQGTTTTYYLGYHFYTDSSGIEHIEQAVSTTKEETTGFRAGGSDLYMWLYSVTQNGLTLESVTQLAFNVGTLPVISTTEPDEADGLQNGTFIIKVDA